MLTRPFTRLVVAFGTRKVTQRRLVEEAVLGLLVLVPFGIVVGLLTSRVCTKMPRPAWFRSDIWTTIVVFLVGDVLMEWLLPSLSCLPVAGTGVFDIREDEYHYTPTWLLQSYGLYCPPDFASSDSLLSPDATAVLFSIRLVFLCLGVHVGESLCWVALTGGIATGKSTVGRLFVEYDLDRTEGPEVGGESTGGSGNTNHNNKASSSGPRNRRKSKKMSSSEKKRTSDGSGGNGDDKDDMDWLEDDGDKIEDDDGFKEGTVNLICADSIAHEVILPPQVLAGEVSTEDGDDKAIGGGDHGHENDEESFMVQPQDSVYPAILNAFKGKEILAPDGCIDRQKLGAIVFNSKEERRKLNRITHPRILSILLRQLLRSVFWGNCDITIADLPLLFESGKLSWLFGLTICVTVSDPQVQLDRLMKRNPELSKEECQARIDSQIPLKKKEAMADIVIDNSGSLEDLSEQVESVRRDLMGRLYGIGMSLLQMLLLIGGSTSIAVSSKFYTHWQQ